MKMNRINDDEMERILSRCAGLSTHALTPVVPLPGATVDSDSEQSDSEPYYKGKDNEDEDRMDESDSLIRQESDDPEFMTPNRMNNNPPVDQRKNDSRSTSTKRESGKRTVMKKPSFMSGHYQYSIPKYNKHNPDKTERPRHRSRTRSSSRDPSTRRSSTPRGPSSSKKREHKRRGEGK